MTNPDQLDLFDNSPVDLTPAPGVEVLSKELSDQWQADFYGVSIEDVQRQTKAPSKKKKSKAYIRAFPRPFIPKDISREWMWNVTGRRITMKMIKVAWDTDTNCTKIIYQADIDGKTEYTYDLVHVSDINHAIFYLNRFEVKSKERRIKALSGDYSYYMSVCALFSFAIRRGDVEVDVVPLSDKDGHLEMRLKYRTQP